MLQTLRFMLTIFMFISAGLAHSSEATFYSDMMFKGNSFTLGDGEIRSNLALSGMDRTISSIKVNGDICVVGYDKEDFKRNYRLFGKGEHENLANLGYDNRIASLIVVNASCRELRFSVFYQQNSEELSEFDESDIMTLPQNTRIPHFSANNTYKFRSIRVYRGQTACLFTSRYWDAERSFKAFRPGNYQISDGILTSDVISSVNSIIIGPQDDCPVMLDVSQHSLK